MIESDRRSQPPLSALARRLLRLCAGRRSGDAMAADLLEEHARFVRPERGRTRSALWFWGQVLRSGAHVLREGGTTTMGSLWQDVRYALRGLRVHPVFTATAVVTLGLGVGGTAAIHTVLRETLLRPLPFDEPGRVHVLWDVFSWQPREFALLRNDWRAFESVAAWWPEQTVVQVGEGAASAEMGVLATHELFDVLGREALLGRTLTAEDESPGRGEVGRDGEVTRVAVVSHGLWQELGGSPEILDRTLRVNGSRTRVVGVMPPGFYFPDPGVRLWRPLTIDPERGGGFLALVGRTAEGADPATVRAELDRAAARLGATFEYPPEFDRTRSPALTPVKDYLYGDTRTPLLMVAGALVLTLVIACANVAALLLARTDARRSELAVRAAVGAGRGRLARQLWTETLVLGGLAGVVAAAVGAAALTLLGGVLPMPPGVGDTLSLDPATLLVALAVGVGSGALVGLGPAIRLVRGRGSLAGSGRRRGVGGGRMESALVVAEVAVALLLVAGAGLLVRSVGSLTRIDTGVRSEGAVVVDLVAGGGDFASDERPDLYRTLRERAAAVSGVESAGLTQKLPLRGRGWISGVSDLDAPGGRELFAFVRYVSPGYLESLGVPLLRGRMLDAALDGPGTTRSALVNETLARALWPEGGALGRRTSDAMGNAVTVVGVVGDVKEGALTDPPEPALYAPLAQTPIFLSPTLVARTAPGAESAAAVALRRALEAAEPRVAVDRVTTLEAVVDEAQGEALRVMRLLTVLGGLALVLGAVGVYGVLSHWVGHRTRAWAVALALGSSPKRVVRSVLARGLGLVGVGLLLGGVAFALAARSARALLHGVSPLDPVALGGAAAALLAAGFLAAWLPARRAARVDPMTTLRGE